MIPLPEPASWNVGVPGWRDGVEAARNYTAAQMRAYAAAAVAAERERCAKVCEEVAERHLRSGRYVSIVADHSVRAGGQVDGAEECAAAIREPIHTTGYVRVERPEEQE